MYQRLKDFLSWNAYATIMRENGKDDRLYYDNYVLYEYYAVTHGFAPFGMLSKMTTREKFEKVLEETKKAGL